MKHLLLLLPLLGACAFDSVSFDALRCDNPGERQDGRVCQDGFWVGLDASMDASPDLSPTDATPDLRPADMPDPQDMPDVPDPQDMPDVPPDTPDMELCPDGPADVQVCNAAGATCGVIATDDPCASGPMVDCTVALGVDCDADADCVNNACVCPPATCPMGAECGVARNGCGNETDCGNACPDAQCDTVTNTCDCAPEDLSTFCKRLINDGALECGPMLSGMDNCRMPRTEDCSAFLTGCGADESCEANACVCPTPQACPGGQTCGSFTNACGGTVTCVSQCTSGNSCINDACETPVLTASDASPNDRFGRAVAIHGDWIVVGAPSYNAGGQITTRGRVYVYNRDPASGTWAETQTLDPPRADIDAEFGRALAFDGQRLIVGAPGMNGGGTSRGEAFIYALSGNRFTLEHTIDNGASEDNARFGQEVDIDGNIAAVGAPFQDVNNNVNQGIVRVYERLGVNWNAGTPLRQMGQAEDYIGYDIDVLGDRVLIGSFSSTKAFLYQQTPASAMWVSTRTFEETPTAGAFGRSVSLLDNLAIAGAPSYESQGTPMGQRNYGAVFPYRDDGASWTSLTPLLPAGTPPGIQFGLRMSAWGSILAIASADGFNNMTGTFNGLVRILRHQGAGVFTEVGSGDNTNSFENYGDSLGVWEDAQVVRVVIGATWAPNGGRVEVLEFPK